MHHFGIPKHIQSMIAIINLLSTSIYRPVWESRFMTFGWMLLKFRMPTFMVRVVIRAVCIISTVVSRVTSVRSIQTNSTSTYRGSNSGSTRWWPGTVRAAVIMSQWCTASNCNIIKYKISHRFAANYIITYHTDLCFPMGCLFGGFMISALMGTSRPTLMLCYWLVRTEEFLLSICKIFCLRYFQIKHIFALKSCTI